MAMVEACQNQVNKVGIRRLLVLGNQHLTLEDMPRVLGEKENIIDNLISYTSQEERSKIVTDIFSRRSDLAEPFLEARLVWGWPVNDSMKIAWQSVEDKKEFVRRIYWANPAEVFGGIKWFELPKAQKIIKKIEAETIEEIRRLASAGTITPLLERLAARVTCYVNQADRLFWPSISFNVAAGLPTDFMQRHNVSFVPRLP